MSLLSRKAADPAATALFLARILTASGFAAHVELLSEQSWVVVTGDDVHAASVDVATGEVRWRLMVERDECGVEKLIEVAA